MSLQPMRAGITETAMFDEPECTGVAGSISRIVDGDIVEPRM